MTATVVPRSQDPPPSSTTKQQRKIPTLALVAPSVVALLLWMIVPLAMALWFAFQRYNLLLPDNRAFVGIENFTYILTDPALWVSI
ncbi:MAG: sugar ABC transporter permease, partial [Cyanobacteria bacterium J06649_5]